MISPKYSPIVEKEIKYALKNKKGKCLIFIRLDCFSKLKSNETKNFIAEIKDKDYVYCKYSGSDDLKRKIKDMLPPLIKSNLK